MLNSEDDILAGLLSDEPVESDGKKPKETPSQRMQRMAEELRAAYDTVASSEAGIKVLQHILMLTGYQDSVVTLDPATLEVNIKATLYNVSKRDVWIEIRRQIAPNLLIGVEHQENKNA